MSVKLNMSVRMQWKNFCQDATEGSNSRIYSLITRACNSCYEHNRLTAADLARRKTVQQNLQQYFRAACPALRNHIFVSSFGSTTNGFGFRYSDLDIYVEGISMNTAEALLRVHPEFSRVRRIRCRVPLIKFYHKETQFIGDLSFQNAIALRNSDMLFRYSQISKKCVLLVYALKHLTKCCKIANARKSFLSSYTYTLMVIHYLQQLETPVLPILQEINPPCFEEKSKYVTNGFDAYFYNEDNKALAQVWLGFGKNRQSIAELFVGLLRYYAHDFDYENEAVCIHKSKCLKNSVGSKKLMSVVDPFENERNLCVPLRPVTDRIIRNLFIRAYQHFCQVPNENFESDKKLMKYFFNPTVLLGEE